MATTVIDTKGGSYIADQQALIRVRNGVRAAALVYRHLSDDGKVEYASKDPLFADVLAFVKEIKKGVVK